MSMKTTLMLGALIPLGLAVSLPVAAMGPGAGPGHERPAFSELDVNGDGELTLDEMMTHRDARFAEADSDGDGSLSRDEMIAAAMGRVEARIDRMMARFDDDENGLLSANEMDDMRPRGPMMERAFARMDSDGDGAISEAEFDEMTGRMMQRRGGYGEGRGHGMQDGEGRGRHGGGQGHGRGWSNDD